MSALRSVIGLAALALLLAAGTALAAQEDVLRPEQAFPYSAVASAEAVLISFELPDGYYLYRKRFQFSSPDDRVSLGDARFPQGEIHEDEFFGKMEIFRRTFTIEVPYNAPPEVNRLDLRMRLQGCADIGLCYPPDTWTIDVGLPQRSAAPPKADLAEILGTGSGKGQTFLPAEQAFAVDAILADPNSLLLRWTIADGYYLYRDKFAISTNSQLIQLGSPELPQGEPKTDEYFGETEVYYRSVEVGVPFARRSPDAGDVTLQLALQGCAEDGICYPPMTREFRIFIPAVDAVAPDAGLAPAAPMSEQDRLALLIGEGNLLLVLSTFFGLGLLLAFTPCVLPMIPILSGIIVGQGENTSTAKATALSVTYVMGMALTYTIAGALFAVAGQQAQAVFQQPWIIIVFSLLFVALALSMFGLFELQVPAALQTRLSDISNKRQTGTYLGTFIVGALSALIVTACVAPPLVAALAVIGQAGDVVRGGLALFFLSLGMGAPLIAFGASAGKILPKAGAWMERVRAFFGFLLLGVAIWMLERILPGGVVMLLWALLAVSLGVFFGALTTLAADASIWRQLARALGVVILAYGLLLLIGLSAGGRDPLQPLAGLGSGPGPTPAEHGVTFTRVKTSEDLDAELRAAASRNQTAMLDFYADWCVSCKEMERYTFTDATVQDALASVHLLQADVTANDDADRALLRRFNIIGPPTIVFFDANGSQLHGREVVGFMPAEEFAAHLQAAYGARSTE
jgi:thiol:disulfide interchange protein DsbD